MSGLKPFWRYYGGKYRAAPRYPKPMYQTIVEPFAGAAGYSLRYPERNVVLVERYAVIAEMWRYLIRVREEEIMAIPAGVVSVDDLPAWVPEPARHLVGWSLNAGTVSPCKVLSAGRRRLIEMGRNFEGWSEAMRLRVATQVSSIRHWRVIEGYYTEAPMAEATWFVDPPYDNAAGAYYVHGPEGIDYRHLAGWCRSRPGQVLVCENEGATWLPFEPFATFKAGITARGVGNCSREVLWTQMRPWRGRTRRVEAAQ